MLAIPAAALCLGWGWGGEATPSVRVDRAPELTRAVETVRIRPLVNTTGNEEAGRIAEAALLHGVEFAGFRIAEADMSAGELLGGAEEETAGADLVLRPTLTLATTGVDKIEWFPFVLHPIGWIEMVGDAFHKSDVVAVQIDLIAEQDGVRTPIIARGYIEQRNLDLLQGVNSVSRGLAEEIAKRIKRASDAARRRNR